MDPLLADRAAADPWMGRVQDRIRRLLRLPCPVILMSVALVVAAPGHAAEGRFGFSGGLNVANLGQDADRLGDDLALELEAQLGGSWSTKKVSRKGLGLGIHYFHPRSPSLGFQVEANYVQRGVGYDITESSLGTVEGVFKLDYFEIPVLLRLTPGGGGGQTVRPMFLLGPVLSFRTGANFEVSAMGQSESVDSGDAFTSAVFGALGGVGVIVQAGDTTHVVVQARYTLGLTNVLDDPSGTYAARFSDFTFLAGLEFGLGN